MRTRWMVLALVPVAVGCNLDLDFTGLGDAFSCNDCWDVGGGGGSWGGPPVSGRAYTVTSDDDVDDALCDATHCSLREAIHAANSRGGTDTIRFDIPGAGPHTIRPGSALPTVADPVVIDGYTQPGASPNSNGPGMGSNAILKIELDGTDAGASAHGLSITAGPSTVRGLVVNRFDGFGITVSGGMGSVLEGNYVGTDATGTIDLGNRLVGVGVSVSSTTVGGDTPSARNVISGNGAAGVQLSGVGRGVGGNAIQGNFIGTDATGTLALGNGSSGISVFDNGSTTIGGTAAAAGNVISGNRYSGVSLHGARETVVQGNAIGTDVTGTTAVGNGGDGVLITTYTVAAGAYNATDNLIGGGTEGAPNVISGNGGAGVRVSGDGAVARNSILANAISSNGSLGIDLGPAGVTPNDAEDDDSGPNDLQNFPVLSSATADGGSISIAGDLNGIATTEFRLEFFVNSDCDPSGHGEGGVFLGSTMVRTGRGGFTLGLTAAVPAGQYVVATATDSNGNSSEFSPCVQVS